MQPDGVAVVTGASRGIGRAVALELAARGFETVATMRQPADGAGLPELAAAAGGVLRVAALDVTDPATIDLPDGLRVLVNNAGTEAPHPAFEDTPAELWQTMFATNVFGLIEVTRRAIPLLRAAGGGVLCNVTSSSILAPVPFYAPYRSSKAAVSAVGESLRAELAPFGIRVLEIMPGPIETDMLEGSDRPPEAIERPEYEAIAQRMYEGRQAVAGMTTPADVAARAIVDAIVDDDAPLRVGCDPMSVGMLDAWRSQSDETLMQSMLPTWAHET
ncbi:MAG TPA: SDR family NAD(P)-dependent oxidoreductase [Acidimicrobiia bacterium]|nr:SDR family NAD(P)-dependent oxidoreductase [Acidimicrobiia bacterium]